MTQQMHTALAQEVPPPAPGQTRTRFLTPMVASVPPAPTYAAPAAPAGVQSGVYFAAEVPDPSGTLRIKQLETRLASVEALVIAQQNQLTALTQGNEMLSESVRVLAQRLMDFGQQPPQQEAPAQP